MHSLQLLVTRNAENKNKVETRILTAEYANEGDTDLPFKQDLELPAVLTILEGRRFRPTDFTPKQLEWLRSQRLVEQRREL